jgi:hypothetical protein
MAEDDGWGSLDLGFAKGVYALARGDVEGAKREFEILSFTMTYMTNFVHLKIIL